jgi:hypothetical protein
MLRRCFITVSASQQYATFASRRKIKAAYHPLSLNLDENLLAPEKPEQGPAKQNRSHGIYQ